MEPLEAVGHYLAIIVEKNNNVSGGSRGASISRRRRPLIWPLDQSRLKLLAEKFEIQVASIVGDDHLHVAPLAARADCTQTAGEVSLAVVSGNNDT